MLPSELPNKCLPDALVLQEPTMREGKGKVEREEKERLERKGEREMVKVEAKEKADCEANEREEEKEKVPEPKIQSTRGSIKLPKLTFPTLIRPPPGYGCLKSWTSDPGGFTGGHQCRARLFISRG
ncbi:hypothetical protein BDM02DRAFT_3119981 [Thelephora ganbajun]|uniref:Uncharacterized protein n=1 Tax=Thelephora ganbajun TaxID=370292 RepID=A0ACB6Z775_THEGA|nr:hypothetical protein BDM02DRAFT_3119981 [Thelephora ganbajun]